MKNSCNESNRPAKTAGSLPTKERILLESLKLFSVYGFDSVSVRKIAAAVGVRDSALYKHFKSKQAIFDALVERSKERFYKQYESIHMKELSLDNLPGICLDMFHFQTQDEWIVMFRKMLLIEHYKNPAIAETYKELFIHLPIHGQKKLFEALIEQGIMKDKNAEVMSMELYAPFFIFHTISTDESILEPLLEKHVENFIESYFIPLKSTDK